VSRVSTIKEGNRDVEKPRAPGAKPFRNLEEARRAGQLELPFPRAVDPKVRAAKLEAAALRRQRRRKRRMGVFG
jgi:hypothetical protein